MSKIFAIIFTLFLCHTNSKGDTEKFVINTSKSVLDTELGDIKDACDIIRIDFPRAKPVFMYSSNNVDFCLFDLNKDNKFVILTSPLFPQVIKFSVNGVDQTKAIQECFINLSSGVTDNVDSLRSFGGIFELGEDKACELQIGGDINAGKYLVSLSKKIDTEQKELMPEVTKGWSWWEGSVVITLKKIGIPIK